jgi:hypothetical protein
MATTRTAPSRSSSLSAPWWHGEHGIRINDVPKHVPPRPDGRPISAATAWRWTLRGVRGIAIRRYRVGGNWCTTVEELRRWECALSAAAEAP